MSKPEVVEKMRQSLLGRPFKERGGNGNLTPAQCLLSETLGLPTEYVVPTRQVRGQFLSIPNSYKVDIADPQRKIAIEVDGKGHLLPKNRLIDQKKTDVLTALGWCVLRFSNQQIMEDLDQVVAQVKQCMTLRSQITTTTTQTLF